MSIYYKHLNLNIPILNDFAPLDEVKSQYQTIMTDHIGMHLHPLFLNFLRKKNVYVPYVESFCSWPNIMQPIHIDNQGGDYIKLNYVLGGKDSLMHWYTVKPGISVEMKLTDVSTEYLGYEENQVDLVDSAPINPLSIVQVGVPHNITNPIEDRLCISMHISHWHNHQRLTMAEATEIFSEYIIN